MDNIPWRLRQELNRLGLSQAEASRLIGEGPQGLRDVCTGRKRASAELLGQLAEKAAIDVVYVLTRPSEWGGGVSCCPCGARVHL